MLWHKKDHPLNLPYYGQFVVDFCCNSDTASLDAMAGPEIQIRGAGIQQSSFSSPSFPYSSPPPLHKLQLFVERYKLL